MENEKSHMQQPSYGGPTPPQQVEQPEGTEETVVHNEEPKESESEPEEKVQDRDWYNGKPEVTAVEKEQLEAHKPEEKQDLGAEKEPEPSPEENKPAAAQTTGTENGTGEATNEHAELGDDGGKSNDDNTETEKQASEEVLVGQNTG